MADISTLSNSFVGMVCPFLTQVIRDRWVQVDGQAAHWLSLVVAAGCVLAATWINHGPFDPTILAGDVGLAFTLSQVVYNTVLKDMDNARSVTQPVEGLEDDQAPLLVPGDTPEP